MMKKSVGALLWWGLLCGTCLAVVPIDFFYEPGCHDCERMEQELLPEIDARFGTACSVTAHDIGIETNFLYLLHLEDRAGHAGPERGYLIVGKQVVFGASPNAEAVFSEISRQLKSESSGGGRVADPSALIDDRFRGFTLSAILVAGLLDGINPCAISTLIFFMSLLAVSKVRSRRLILLGASYVAASFFTYLALGFGLFRIFHLFSGFTALRSAMEWGMIAILLILAVFSFRDAVRFRTTHDGHEVSLQLSLGMKKRIHAVMRRGVKSGHLIWGGWLAGMAVTALESVCTGQVYVPTLVLIVKSSAEVSARAWVYLILYNLLFILPLGITFVAVYLGLRTETLLRWSRRNLVRSKLLLGAFFVLMASFLLYL